MAERNYEVARIRSFIVTIFDAVCIAFVVIPTALALLIALVGVFGERPTLFGFLIAALVLIVTAFLAGGALTLVNISDHTEQIAKTLKHLEEAELRPIADDVHRLESADRDARNLAAVGTAATSSS